MTYSQWKLTSPTYRAYLQSSARCEEAFDTTTYTGPAPEFSEWRHPGTGETRHYINNVTKLIATSHLNLSNTRARELRDYINNSKFWLTTDGKLHTRYAYGSPRAMDKTEITDIVKTAINTHQ